MGYEKLEADVEIRSTVDDFFELLTKQAHLAPESTDLVHTVELHEGEWDKPGHVKTWHYTTLEGEKEEFKEKFEVDEANKTFTMVAVGGHLLEQVKSYKTIYKCIPKEAGGGVVKITMEYELFKPEDPHPKKYLPFIVKFVQDVDAGVAHPID